MATSSIEARLGPWNVSLGTRDDLFVPRHLTAHVPFALSGTDSAGCCSSIAQLAAVLAPGQPPFEQVLDRFPRDFVGRDRARAQ